MIKFVINVADIDEVCLANNAMTIVSEKLAEDKEKPVHKKAPIEKKPKAEKHLSSKDAASGEKKTMVKKGSETYKNYIYKLLKQVYHNIGIFSKGMDIMNPFINDIFEKPLRRHLD